MIAAWLAPAVFVLSWGLTGVVRRYALSQRMLDVPNARSFHSVPTPRGGGVAIILAFVAGLAVPLRAGLLHPRLFIALAGAGLWVGVIGFIDDRKHLRVRLRLLAHCVGAAWALWWVGGLAPIHLLGRDINLGWFGVGLAVVALVWLLNLYNFMDGIDGVAGVEAVTVCAAAAAIDLLLTNASDWFLPVLLMSAVAGFLLWNLPPAKIFMGDAGSGFLGLTLGVIAAASSWQTPSGVWVWLILLGVFVVDATVTLARRALRRELVHHAHRSHAYQHAALRYGPLRVDVAIAAINCLFLAPLAACVAVGRIGGDWALLAAYAPLAWLAVRFQAGAASHK